MEAAEAPTAAQPDACAAEQPVAPAPAAEAGTRAPAARRRCKACCMELEAGEFRCASRSIWFCGPCDRAKSLWHRKHDAGTRIAERCRKNGLRIGVKEVRLILAAADAFERAERDEVAIVRKSVLQPLSIENAAVVPRRGACAAR